MKTLSAGRRRIQHSDYNEMTTLERADFLLDEHKGLMMLRANIWTLAATADQNSCLILHQVLMKKTEIKWDYFALSQRLLVGRKSLSSHI